MTAGAPPEPAPDSRGGTAADAEDGTGADPGTGRSAGPGTDGRPDGGPAGTAGRTSGSGTNASSGANANTRATPRTGTTPRTRHRSGAEPRPDDATSGTRAGPGIRWFLVALGVTLCLAVVSLFVGAADLRPADLFDSDASGDAARLVLLSRLPRTLALVLAGMALSVVGLIMQMLTQNRFVEPSTAGTVEFAGLGILVVTLLAPGVPVFTKMVVASVFALVGTGLFLRMLRMVRTRSVLIVPLLGITLGGVVGAISTFLAYRHDLLQSLSAWMNADFSSVIRGRYELLWIVAALTLVAYVAADRFTVAGMGEEFTTNLGLNHRRVMAVGLTIASLTTAVIVTTVGAIPFLGLVVPNIAVLIVGDNLRRSIPWVAVLGAGFVLACDLIGRIVRYPYEIPIGTVVGVVGSGLFLYLILRRPPAHGR